MAHRDPEYNVRLAAIHSTCEADWRNSDFIVFNRPGLTKKTAFDNLMAYYAPMVIGHEPFVYTKKFTGSEKTFADSLLLDGIHDMLQPTM